MNQVNVDNDGSSPRLFIANVKGHPCSDYGRVEKTLDSLEAQHSQLVRQLEAQSLTSERIKSIKEHAFKVSQDLETFRYDFDGRRRFIELLDLKIKLKVEEEGQKVVYASCCLGNERLPTVSNTMCANVGLC